MTLKIKILKDPQNQNRSSFYRTSRSPFQVSLPPAHNLYHYTLFPPPFLSNIPWCDPNPAWFLLWSTLSWRVFTPPLPQTLFNSHPNAYKSIHTILLDVFMSCPIHKHTSTLLPLFSAFHSILNNNAQSHADFTITLAPLFTIPSPLLWCSIVWRFVPIFQIPSGRGILNGSRTTFSYKFTTSWILKKTFTWLQDYRELRIPQSA